MLIGRNDCIPACRIYDSIPRVYTTYRIGMSERNSIGGGVGAS